MKRIVQFIVESHRFPSDLPRIGRVYYDVCKNVVNNLVDIQFSKVGSFHVEIVTTSAVRMLVVCDITRFIFVSSLDVKQVIDVIFIS